MNDKINRFEDLEVWKESMRLAVAVYEALKPCRDFGLKDQMQRAAVSIPSNISEGYDRQSNKEFIQFLYVAKGSSAELRTQLDLAERVKLIQPEIAHNLLELTRKVSAMLSRLIQVRKERFN